MKKLFFVMTVALLLFVIPEGVRGETTSEDGKEVMDGMISEIDFTEIDHYLEEEDYLGDMTFTELVGNIISEKGWDAEKIFTWAKDKLTGELEKNKALMVELLMLTLAFAFLKNFTEVFGNAYISEISFMLVYGILMVLLMKSFLLVREITETALIQIIDFMKMLVPVLGLSMVFTAQTISAAGFYQLIYLQIYLIQCVLLNIVLPAILVYVLIQFLNFMLEGEKFSRMTELIEILINWTLKFLMGLVVGMNMIQGMLKPALDRLNGSAISKTFSMIPGIGNTISSVGEIFLSSGMVIKNGVGIAGIIILVLICALPVIKILVITLCYKVAAAFCEPVSDKRISGCMNGIYRGSVLVMKLLLLVMLLFFITIAMVVVSTSWVN